jgi:hypothetical protein
MTVKRILPALIFSTTLLALSGCATNEDLQRYATKDEMSSLRTELLDEIRKAEDSARAAEENSAASAALAESAAEDARAASEKADAIFLKSLKK